MERNISPYEKKHGFDEESTPGTKSLLNDYEEGMKTFRTDATAPMDIKTALEEAAKLGGEFLIHSNIYASIPRALEAEERLVQKLQSIENSQESYQAQRFAMDAGQAFARQIMALGVKYEETALELLPRNAHIENNPDIQRMFVSGFKDAIHSSYSEEEERYPGSQASRDAFQHRAEFVGMLESRLAEQLQQGLEPRGQEMPASIYATTLSRQELLRDISEIEKEMRVWGDPEAAKRALQQIHLAHNGQQESVASQGYVDKLSDSVLNHPSNAPNEHIARLQPTAEEIRHWEPLTKTVDIAESESFTWHRETDGIQSYRGEATQGWIHIDALGNVYNRNVQAIDLQSALEKVNAKAIEEPEQLIRIENSYGMSM